MYIFFNILIYVTCQNKNINNLEYTDIQHLN